MRLPKIAIKTFETKIENIKAENVESDRNLKETLSKYYPLDYDGNMILPKPIINQIELCSERPGDRHLKFDLTTLCLRHIREPLKEQWDLISTLLSIALEPLPSLFVSKNFMQQLNGHLSKAMSNSQKQDIKAKIVEYNSKCIKSSWSNVTLMATLAHYMLLNSNISEAIPILKCAQSFANTNYFTQKGYYLEFYKSDLLSAARMYRRALEALPTNSAALTNLAVLQFYHNIDTLNMTISEQDSCQKTNHTEVALNLLRSAIRFDDKKTNYVAHYHYAFINETQLENFSLARQHYAQALSINPNHLESHTALGSLLMEMKQFENALEHYEIAKKLAPDRALVYYNISNCLGRMGNINAALSEIQSAIRLDSTQPYTYYHLGNVLAQSGDIIAASESFEKAYELSEQYPAHNFDTSATINSLVAIYRQIASKKIVDGETIEDFEEAARFLTQSIDLMNTENPEYTCTMLVNLAFCFMKSKRPSDSIEAISDALKLGGPSYVDQFRLIKQEEEISQEIYVHLEENILHLEHVEAIINGKLKPKKKLPKSSKSSKSKNHKIKISKVKKNEVSLKHDFSPLDQIDPNKVELSYQDKRLKLLYSEKAQVLYNLAFCMFYIGNLDEVISYLKQAVELDPNCTSNFVVEKQKDNKNNDEENVGEDIEQEIEDTKQMEIDYSNTPDYKYFIEKDKHINSPFMRSVKQLDDYLELNKDDPNSEKFKKILEKLDNEHRDKDWSYIEELITKKTSRPIRKQKSKRRKNIIYSKIASKKSMNLDPDDGFDSK